MGDPTILELVKQTASHAAEIAELARRIGVLEERVWVMTLLVISTLMSSLASVFFSRKAANGKKGAAG